MVKAVWWLLFGAVLLGLAPESQAIDKRHLRWVRDEPRIDSVHLEGVEYFPVETVKDRLYSRTRTLWLALKGDRRSRVHRETRQRDTLEIQYLYLSNGFLNVQVDHSFIPLKPLQQDSLPPAMVKIVIDEGKQYRYGPRRLEGDFEERFRQPMLNMILKLEAGEPVNVFEMSATSENLKTYLANRGYPYAKISRVVDTAGSPDACPVVYTVLSDSLVHFGAVQVEIVNPQPGTNASRYSRHAALREVKIDSGNVYRREDILESQRRLFESGYYTTFQLDRTNLIQNRLHPDFLLRVTERRPHYFAFRVGAAQSDVRDLQWDLSAGVGKRNFFKTRTVELSSALAFSAGEDTRLLDNNLKLQLTEPWFLGIRMKAQLAGEVQFRIKDPVKDFEKEERSFSGVFSKWFGRKLWTSLGLQYQYIKISGIPADEIPLIKEQEGISARRRLFFSIRRDSRSDPFIPRRGSLTEFHADFYGGFLRGDADFFKIQGSWSRYRQVWPGWIAATRLRGAWAEAFGDTKTVPVDEALYLGGASTVRGFRENHLGPLDADGDPEGARYTIALNHEFRWRTIQYLNILPLVGDIFKRFPQWQSLFVDVGNGFRNRDEMQFRNLAVAYGTGLQIVTPAGPIRIDRAWVLEHDDFEYTDRWHFTILYAF